MQNLNINKPINLLFLFVVLSLGLPNNKVKELELPLGQSSTLEELDLSNLRLKEFDISRNQLKQSTGKNLRLKLNPT